MAKKSSKSAIPKWKKKKWYELIAPSIYSEKSLGETLADSPETIIGKVVEVNLMNITGNPRKQSFTIKLRVVKVQGNKGITKPIKLQMLHSSVKRLIRSGRDRVDASFIAVSKDGVELRIKPLIVTKNYAPNSRITDLIKKSQEFLTDYIRKNNYEAVFDTVTRSVLQKETKKELDKIFPVKMIEIRGLEVELKKGERDLRTTSDVSDVKETSETEEKSDEKEVVKEEKKPKKSSKKKSDPEEVKEEASSEEETEEKSA